MALSVKELQIGDWVKSELYGKQQICFVARTEHEWYNYYNCGQCCDNTEASQPIPLTPEILEKNGFVESEIERKEFSDIGLRYTYETQDGSYLIVDWQDSFDNGCGGELHEGQKELWIITVFGCNGLFESNPHERAYVHELQHALRLCGLNELADGFKV